ncbi:lipopolysaccharide biosynthesis protein [Allomuricauda sp. R78024]|uniref:lipopolysaccharide biosynthesis protein n=1 Tax=Allomuricauda sp. R78024 TaxID=3093867 RepID=UPI0037CB3678
MLNKFINGFSSSDFFKNVVTLVSGFAIAQVIPLILSPVLTRVFTTKDFGLLGAYTGLSAILAVFAAGRYDFSIIEPKHDKDAKNLIVSSFFFTIAYCFILLLIAIFFNEKIALLIGNIDIKWWLYLIPFSVFLISNISTLSYWLNRKKLYKEKSTSKIISSSSVTLSSLLIGIVTRLNGLILGTIIGQVFNIFYLYKKASLKGDYFNKKRSLVLLKRYKEYPRYLMFATFTGAIASNAPVILFTSYFDASIAGCYALSQRITSGTVTMIGNAIGEVYRQKASENYASFGNCKELFVQTFKRLFLMGIVPFLVLFFFSETMFVFVFGDEWLIAGTMTKYLSFSIFLNFLSTPLSYTIVFNKSQRGDMFLQIFRAAFSIFAIYIGYTMADYVVSVKLYTLTYSVYYIFHTLLQYRSASGYKKLKFL